MHSCHWSSVTVLLSYFSILWFVSFLLHISPTVMVTSMQVAELIKDDLWPNPLTYFNNVSSLQFLYLFVVLFPFILFPMFLKVFDDSNGAGGAWRRGCRWRRRWWGNLSSISFGKKHRKWTNILSIMVSDLSGTWHDSVCAQIWVCISSVSW